MMNLSDSYVLKYVLELRELLALVRQHPEFAKQLDYQLNRVPELHLARFAEREANNHIDKILAGEIHRRARTLVATIHSIGVQASQQGKLGSRCSMGTCAHLRDWLGVDTRVEQTSEFSQLWELSLLVDNYAWVLGTFDNDKRPSLSER